VLSDNARILWRSQAVTILVHTDNSSIFEIAPSEEQYVTYLNFVTENEGTRCEYIQDNEKNEMDCSFKI
jgi:hypothetical protein